MAENISYQTLNGFLEKPFGKKETTHRPDYESKYQTFNKFNKIKMSGFVVVDDVYFIHIQVPSESALGEFYDVVLEFFTTDEDVKKEKSLSNYHIQFFSNSPGFVYNYATLYKLNGYLIESLYEKYDKEMLNVLPEKTNSSFVLSYDKSIYFACRYMQENKLWIQSKLGLKLTGKQKNPERFFESIQDIESVNMVHKVANMEASIKKEIKKDNAESVKRKKEKKNNNTVNRVTSKEKKKPLAKLSKIGKKATIVKKTGSRTTIK